MTTPETQSTALALLRGELMTALARIEGDIRLLIQQGEHGSRRVDDLERKVEHLDAEVDALKETSVRKADLEAREAEKSRRNIALATLAMTGTGIVSGAGVAILTTLIK